MTVNRNNAKTSANLGDVKTDVTAVTTGTDGQTKEIPPNTEEPEKEQPGTSPDSATTESFNLPVHIKKITIEEKLQRFEELEQLKERREQVIDGLENLRGFYISTTSGASVVMTDGRNKRLQVSHPIAIEAMVKSATERMGAELAAIEEKFTI